MAILIIHSISDIITNSSSEIFVMKDDIPSFLGTDNISYEYINSENHWICQRCQSDYGADPEDIVGHWAVIIKDSGESWEYDCSIAREECLYHIWNH